jgi:hypothetical protein
MKQFSFPTNRKQTTINAYVVTKTPQKITIVAYDKKKKNTQYLNHYGMVDRKSPDGLYRRKFEVLMPQSPDELKVVIYNNSNFDKKTGKFKVRKDPTFKVEKFGVSKLRKWEIWMNQHTQDFVKFAQDFAENAGVLTSWEEGGKTDTAGLYQSDNKKFKIRYYDVIRNKEGKALTTPARISNKTAIIEVSKKAFAKYSVAMRMMILLHEYSHFYLNKNMENEIQADLNGLYVYLGLGYSPIEAHRAFLYVFNNADTEGNALRYKMIEKYILDFYSGNIAVPSGGAGGQQLLRKSVA